jgi:hypothetical protein
LSQWVRLVTSRSGRRYCSTGALLGGGVLELGVARGLAGGVLEVGRPVRTIGPEQLDEQLGMFEIGLDGACELGAALQVVALRQHVGAVLLEIGQHLVAFVIEIVGNLGEQDDLACKRAGVGRRRR